MTFANCKTRVANIAKSFISDQSGVTAIEYGLIATLVALAIVVAAGNLGTALSTTFGNIVAKL
jgi:pilus assembly protein Flp/PilA